MSAAILDRARAFEMIAHHLTDEMRSEIAEAIAEKLLAEITPTRAHTPTAPAPEPEPLVDLSGHTQVASFLADHGYTRKALVDATVALTAWLTANEGRYTREAGMRVWLSQQKGAA